MEEEKRKNLKSILYWIENFVYTFVLSTYDSNQSRLVYHFIYQARLSGLAKSELPHNRIKWMEPVVPQRDLGALQKELEGLRGSWEQGRRAVAGVGPSLVLQYTIEPGSQ